MTRVRVLVADDHETVREGLKAILSGQPDIEVVGEAGDGQTAVALARRLTPHVVLMDISMPSLNGLAATVALRQASPKSRVLVLTRHSEHGYLQQILRAGASGYVLKQSRAADLSRAIRAVAEGGTFIDPAIASDLVAEYKDMGAQPPARELSPRELQVLRLVAWGYSNKEIAERLTLSVKTVETHKSKAMHKLGLKSRIDVVQYAVLLGWLQHD